MGPGSVDIGRVWPCMGQIGQVPRRWEAGLAAAQEAHPLAQQGARVFGARARAAKAARIGHPADVSRFDGSDRAARTKPPRKKKWTSHCGQHIWPHISHQHRPIIPTLLWPNSGNLGRDPRSVPHSREGEVWSSPSLSLWDMCRLRRSSRALGPNVDDPDLDR